MDEKALKKYLDLIAGEAIPAGQDPWPAVSKLVTRDKRIMKTQSQSTPRRIAVSVGLALALFAAVLLFTPQGRVLAQQIIGFFSRTDQETFPLTPEQIGAPIPGEEPAEPQPTVAPPPNYVFFTEECAGLDEAAAYTCQVQHAAQTAGFAPAMPPLEDSGLWLSSLAVDTASNTVLAGFGYSGYPDTGGSVHISQGVGDFPAGSEWDKVPEHAVQAVTVAGNPAEYVEGSFVVRPGDTDAIFTAEVPISRLRWRDGERWFEFFKAGAPEMVTYMDRAGILNLAESLVEIQ
jgi:hypothetical protein